MAVGGVGVECDVGYDTDVGDLFFDFRDGTADEVVGVIAFRAVFGFFILRGNGEEGDGFDAEIMGLFCGFDGLVGGEPVDAGKAVDGLADILAFGDEEGPDEISGGDVVFGDEVANPWGRAEAAHACRGVLRVCVIHPMVIANMSENSRYKNIVAQVRANGLGVITLDRPAALNALSHEMILGIADVLEQWRGDDTVLGVLFVGAGERSFCAGGDVKVLYQMVSDSSFSDASKVQALRYFEDEYALNRGIFHYPKPTAAFMDGIVMGGGYGIAGHCDVRIATQRTMFAMPEVKIGFFPDVGAAYHLVRVAQGFGHYLAVSGDSIGAGDMVASGLADCFTGRSVEEIVEQFQGGFDVAALSETPPEVQIFGGDAVFEDDSGARSPLSVSVTRRLMKVVAGLEFDAVMDLNLRLVERFLAGADFYEGVRAVLVDKDHTPRWEFGSVEDVPVSIVDGYFAL